ALCIALYLNFHIYVPRIREK
ncbi:hypothetical protein A5794_001596, partial [Enterococcus faecium]